MLQTPVITDTIRADYRRRGFVVLRNVLPAEILRQANDVCQYWVDVRERDWIEAGLLSRTYQELPIEKRILASWNDAGRPHFDRRAIYHYNIHPQMFQLMTSAVFLDIAGGLLQSDELSVSAVTNARPKHHSLPWSKVAWHADLAYWEESTTQDPLDFAILWYPLRHVDAERGCLQLISMEVVKGSDFRYDNKTIFITDEAVEKYPFESIVMEPGDVLCMCDNVIHRSCWNQHDPLVWTLDHRYEVTAAASKGTRSHGVIARSVKCPESVTTLEQWMAKREPKDYLTRGGKEKL